LTTSGTTAFSLDLLDIIEEAYEMVGTVPRTGYTLKTARRSLDILMKEWANRGINLWTISESSSSVAASTTTVTLDTDSIDVLDCVWRTGTGSGQFDRQMTRISVSQWANTANKNQTGDPSLYWVNRLLTGPVVTIWPVPTDAGTLVYWKVRRIEDTGSYTNTMDIPPRFLPALTTGLAYYLAMKSPNAVERLPLIQQEYNRQFDLASQEDREKAPLRLIPDLG